MASAVQPASFFRENLIVPCDVNDATRGELLVVVHTKWPIATVRLEAGELLVVVRTRWPIAIVRGAARRVGNY